MWVTSTALRPVTSALTCGLYVRACVWSRRRARLTTTTTDKNQYRQQALGRCRHSTPSWWTDQPVGLSARPSTPPGQPNPRAPCSPAPSPLTCCWQTARLAGNGCMQEPGRKRISLFGVHPPHPWRGEADAGCYLVQSMAWPPAGCVVRLWLVLQLAHSTDWLTDCF